MTRDKRSFFNKTIALVLLLLVIISMVSPVSARAESIDGGLGSTCYDKLTVWTTANKSAVRGYVYAHESFTILSKSGNVYHIQYSSSSGTKDGYLVGETINDYTSRTCVGSAKSNTTVYYGPNTSLYDTAGTIYSGEYVVVIGTDGTWDYIEYNTSKGRKRGYVLRSNLSFYNIGMLNTLSIYNFSSDYYVNLNTGATNRTIYAAPYSQSNQIGSVNSADNPIYYCAIEGSCGETYWYVRYTNFSTGKYKTGYLKR